MHICIEHSRKAYLPEVHAYSHFFSSKGHQCDVFSNEEADDYDGFDVRWCFPGISRHRKGEHLLVHDYNSLSTGAFPRTKNRIKRLLNTTPDLRIFQNPECRNDFAFDDYVPHCFRDMGVSDKFFRCTVTQEKRYEFVYAGNLGPERRLLPWLDYFDKSGRKTLLVGAPPVGLFARYRKSNAITFTGPVHYDHVPACLAQAEYGLNLIPNRYPYPHQASTKLLEYCAMGLKVISTPHEWSVRLFGENDSKFFRVQFPQDLLSKKLEGFCFSNPDVSEYNWRNVIERSGIEQMLKKIL